MQEKRDIFDRMMALPILNIFEPFYKKNKEVLLYLFFGGRVVTLVIEEIILLVFITWLGFNSMVVKVIAQVIVIVLNYVISKFWIFKDKRV